MAKLTMLALSCVLLIGCVFPYPHYNWLTPEVHGTVADGVSGKPLSGVLIQYAGTDAPSAISDVDGRFILQPKKVYEYAGYICPGTCAAEPRKHPIEITYKDRSTSAEISNCSGARFEQCNGRSISMDFVLD